MILVQSAWFSMKSFLVSTKQYFNNIALSTEMHMLSQSLSSTGFRSSGRLVPVWVVLILGLALGFSGCAGNDQPIHTLDNLENGNNPNVLTSVDAALNEDEGFEDELFDPFDEDLDEENILEEYDPFESVNAVVFEFNYQFDKYVLKPTAQVYNYFIPPDVQLSVVNMFQNARVVPRFLNNLFQAKFQGAGIELSRFLINSTLGVGGLFDPAKIMFDLETPLEDLGQTLGSYGVPPGPYLVMPFYGPFTLRDGFGFIGDKFLDPFNWLVLPIIEIADAPRLIQHDPTITYAQLGLTTIENVNLRSLTLKTFQGVEEGTLDLYSAIRNGSLQQRQRAIDE